MKTPEGTKISPRVAAFLKEHGCGNRNQDSYGDDWSHFDIECLVELACKLESEIPPPNNEKEKE